MRNKLSLIIALLLSIVIVFVGCEQFAVPLSDTVSQQQSSNENAESVANVPEFSGEPYIVINDNIPDFSSSDMVTQSYEYYSPLDALGRCGVAMASVGADIMPTEERGGIGQVKPTGWHLIKYDCVDGKYLYNRCHLIGYQLTGENANTQNLITGTRYLNVEGMLPFENMIADYVKETKNHVIYRVTPIFKGNNLLASGVQLEAKSVEDEGKGICFNVYAYNSQPDITINYENGDSYLTASKTEESSSADISVEIQYVLNKSTKKFHKTDCGSVGDIKPQNKKITDKSREELISEGYSPCKSCDP